MNEWTNERTNKRTNEQTNERTNERMNEGMNEKPHAKVHVHAQYFSVSFLAWEDLLNLDTTTWKSQHWSAKHVHGAYI